METRHGIAAELSNLEHLGQLLGIACGQVQERKAVKVLDALVTHLHNLMVALTKSLLCQLDPALLLVHDLGSLETDFQVAAFQSQLEPGLVLTHKVQGNLGVALLLQVRNDRLSDKVRVANDLEDLVVVTLGQCLLEAVLGRVNGNGAGLAITVQAVDVLALDARQVDGLIKRTDDSIVTKRVRIYQLRWTRVRS